jgi:ABC-type branched-subunit amino acid transport system ATPase component
MSGTKPQVILRTKKATKLFGGLAAVKDVDLEIRRGEIFGLIGPNGAGKTTVFNVVTGSFPPTEGSILFLGEEITGKKPHQVFRKGIGRTFQTRALFENMSVLGNLISSQIYQTHYGLWDSLLPTQRAKEEEKKLQETALATAEFVGLGHLREKLAKNLTLEERSRLSIGVALAAGPKLILLDEPMAGLNLEEIEKIMELVRTVRRRGITVCMVEHKMSAVMNVSDRIVVLNFGEKIAQGAPAEIVKNPAVMKAYLGEKYASQNQ